MNNDVDNKNNDKTMKSNKTNSVTPIKNECPKCKCVYSTYGNLRKHVKTVHPSEETILAPTRYKSPANYKFSCAICASNFNQEKNLRYHMKTRHKTETPNETQRKPKKCPLCEHQDLSTPDLIRHFEQVHAVVIHKRNIKIANADFQRWKNDVERDTKARFIRGHVKKHKNDVTSESYVCHRSGTYVPEGKGLRHLKTRGSAKINAFCPAGLKVKREKLECQVELIETHVGHECDLDYLWLTKSERETVAQKISAKMPFDRILNEIRGSAPNSGSQRIHLLKRKDLHNIKSSLNLRLSSVEDINENNNKLDVESNAVAMESAEDNNQTSALCEEKEKIKNIINRLVDDATSLSELAVIERIIASISPALLDADASIKK